MNGQVMEPEESISELGTALKYFKGDRKNYTTKDTNIHAANIRKHAETHGVSQQELHHLVRIVFDCKLNSSVSSTLIHSLIPRDSIPEEAVLCAISKICMRRCPLKVLHLMLKWIVLVYDIINTKSKLHSLYGVLFHYIKIDMFSSKVCHLLFLLTRKEDVTHYRISALLDHQRKVGNEPYINALLSVYRSYYPSLIYMAPNIRCHFPKVDKHWRHTVYKFFSRYAPYTDELFFSVAVQIPFDRERKGLIPALEPNTVNAEMKTVDNPILQMFPEYKKITDVKSFADVLANVEKLSLPSQAASLLSSRYLQHFFAISSEPILCDRLGIWLSQKLSEHVVRSNGRSEEGRQLLEIMVLLSDLFQTHLQGYTDFLYRYLSTWNGQDYFELILKLIGKLPLIPFHVLDNCILKVLHKLFTFGPSVQYRCAVLDTLSNLACNYLALELPKRKENPMLSREAESFEQVTETVERLITFVDYIISEGLQLEPHNIRFLLLALTFWNRVTEIILIEESVVLVLPSFPVVYKALFSLSSLCVSKLCGILKNIMGTYCQLRMKNILVPRCKELCRKLNMYLLDIHDTLWRHRAFHPSCCADSIAYRNLDSKHLEPLCRYPDHMPPSSMFSINRHPALLLYTIKYLHSKNLPIEQALDDEFVTNESYFKFLSNEGLSEITTLLTMLTETKQNDPQESE